MVKLPPSWLARPTPQAILIAVIAAGSIGLNTNLQAPPRFDGAGYAVLARSWMEGQGYREIDHPEKPAHAHYPPRYPMVLALLWSVTGPSAPAAHVLSWACSVAATLLAFLWFRRLGPPRMAFFLGLALAVNWMWGRTGGEIQSEPLFLLLSQAALLAAD